MLSPKARFGAHVKDESASGVIIGGSGRQMERRGSSLVNSFNNRLPVRCASVGDLWGNPRSGLGRGRRLVRALREVGEG